MDIPERRGLRGFKGRFCKPASVRWDSTLLITLGTKGTTAVTVAPASVLTAVREWKTKNAKSRLRHTQTQETAHWE